MVGRPGNKANIHNLIVEKTTHTSHLLLKTKKRRACICYCNGQGQLTLALCTLLLICPWCRNITGKELKCLVAFDEDNLDLTSVKM